MSHYLYFMPPESMKQFSNREMEEGSFVPVNWALAPRRTSGLRSYRALPARFDRLVLLEGSDELAGQVS